MKAELLLPAGSIEKMRYAFHYGADAVYLGLGDFSLRTMRKGELITNDNLKSAIDEARSLNKKIYLTLNIFAFDSDMEKLRENLDVIKEANPHAIIISDFGIFNLIKKEMPNTDIHVSTQTNTTNSDSVKFWRDLGASRVILARELSLKQIETIRKNVPDIELEHFIHGAQCMSFSGRCLLSDFMTKNERKANQGGCAQPCRWKYKLLEETRPGEYFEIIEDDKGSHLLSTKDLCLVHYLKDLESAGVNSFKIEGRTKSLYYVSAVAKTYRNVMDNVITPDEGFNELRRVGNRGYTTGFFLGVNEPTSYSYDISKGLAGSDFLCIFKENQNGLYEAEMKNKVLLGDEFEVMGKSEQEVVKVLKIYDKNMQEKDVANTNDIVYFKLSKDIKDVKFALGRSIGIKNEL